MVFAIAALFLQFAPAVHALPHVDLGSVAPVLKTAPAPTPANADQPKSSSATSTKSNSPGVSPVALTVASLENAAQNSQALSTIRVPDSPPAKPIDVISAEGYPRRNWMLLSIAQHSAAAFDAYSTRAAVTTGASEADPFMRPFAHSPAIYAAIQVGPAILDYTARRMQRSQNSFIRRSWWIPQSVSTGMFLASGVHNMSVANRH